MPRKGENIYKRKDGRWEGRYIRSRFPAGKAQYGYVYAKTYREVKNKLGNAIGSLPLHIDSKNNGNKSELFSSVASEWFQNKKCR